MSEQSLSVSVLCFICAVPLVFCALSFWIQSRFEGIDPVTIRKPFGAGFGHFFLVPQYLLGWSGDKYMNFAYNPEDVVKLSITVYSQYVYFKRLTEPFTKDELSYYKRYFTKNNCKGGCPLSNSSCSRGICFCKAKQIFGKCVEEPYLDSQHYDKLKYRRPPCTLDCVPADCYEKVGLIFRVKESMWDLPKCEEDHSDDDNYNPLAVSCAKTDSSSCLSMDLNMICSSETGKCQCRRDMFWNPRTAECELFIDVDCPDEIGVASEDIKMFLTGNKKISLSIKLDYEEVKTAFCALLDSQGEQFVKDNQKIQLNSLLQHPLAPAAINMFVMFASIFIVMAVLVTVGTYRSYLWTVEAQTWA